MTFLEKYSILKKSIPVPAVMNMESIECEYTDWVDYSKNCYYCFDSAKLIDSIYTTLGVWSNKLVDCTSVAESEKCYQSVDSNKCHSCSYLMDCNSCTDCHFSTFLNSCSDCFGCVALTHKKYCIFNKQYTKEEFMKRVGKLKTENPEKILAQMFDLKQKTPHPRNQQLDNENCPYGDYMYNSKNSYFCFSSYYIENSGYNFISANVKNCWDLYYSGSSDNKFISERFYQLIESGRSLYNCAFLAYSLFCINCFYSDHLSNCTDCFGCVGLSNKKYCILNNQLTKDQYAQALKEIKQELGWKSY